MHQLCIICIEILPVFFFSGGEFSAVLTPDSGRALGPLPMFLIPSGVLGEIICKFFFRF
jgi:hypothetical protein